MDLTLKIFLNKLGLSWAKLSCQLGFSCTGINIFFLPNYDKYAKLLVT